LIEVVNGGAILISVTRSKTKAKPPPNCTLFQKSAEELEEKRLLLSC
jgi:hypothetical protein